MVSWPAVPLLKPFRALRYDEGTAGPLGDLVAPPYDVITPESRDRLLARSPWNAVRLVRPDDPAEAARELADWRERGVLVREERPAVWLLEEEFTGPDEIERVRRGIVARVRLRPYGDGVVLPHEGTFTAPKEARLRAASGDAGEAVADLPPPARQRADPRGELRISRPSSTASPAGSGASKTLTRSPRSWTASRARS